MRFTLIILFSLFALNSFSTVYYVASTGNNTTGTSEATAWTSIATVNSKMSTLLPGDQILFKKGETFSGTLNITKSGQAGKSIIFGSFGTASSKPIITTLASITGWVSAGTNIWKSADADMAALSSLKVVTINNLIQRMGRWPNYNATDGGFLAMDATSLNSSTMKATVTDAAFGTSPNWTGATFVYKQGTTVNSYPVDSHTGSSIVSSYYSSTYPPKSGWGCFIQNSIATLDQLNEWYYKPSTHELYIYSPTAPVNVQVATGLNAINSNNASFIIIDGLDIRGSNDNLVNFNNGTQNKINNCDLTFAGNAAVKWSKTTNSRVDNCDINYSLFAALNTSGDFDTLTNSRVKWTEVYDGMGANGPGSSAVGLFANRSYAKGNIVDSTGYFGINWGFGHNYNQIINNVVSNYLLRKTDGGGIYGIGAPSSTDPRGRTIQYGILVKGNVILNGIGTLHGMPAGTGNNTFGIYVDGRSSNVVVEDNFVYKVPRSCMYVNSSDGVTVRRNMFIGSGSQNVYVAQTNSTMTIRGLNFKNNLMFSLQSASHLARFHSWTNDFTQFGSIDSNYYCKPLNEPLNSTSAGTSVILRDIEGSSGIYTSLDKWQSAFPAYDIHSKKTVKTIANASEVRVEYNTTASPVTINLGGKTYVNYKGEAYTKNTLTLQPYTGEVLLITPNVPLDNGTNPSPLVSITAPANNSAYTQPINLSITVSASDADGIAKIEIYNGGILLGTTTPPVNAVVWNSVPSGSWQLTAKAYDTKGASTISAPVNITVNGTNLPPSVSITSPVNNANYITPASINISANAVDNDDYIAKVDFYNGNTLLGTVTTPPYNFTWSGVVPGSYQLKAVTTDSKGAVTTSSPVNISVRGLVAPAINITSPTNNANYTSPANITINATATDADGTVTKVEFYNNNVLINTDVTAPYSYTFLNLSKGAYNLTAKAYDNDGQSSTSSIVTIVSEPNKIPPSVNITSPASGSYYKDPALFNMSATASDADGQVVKVQFYSNGQFIGEDITAPYNVTYSSVMAGTYSITAIAIDNDSIRTTSAPITITVTHDNIVPTIDIIEPATNDTTEVDDGFNITAVANDPDGNITKVEYFNGATLLATVNNAPYTTTLNLAIGTYTITAKATDNSGTTATTTITHVVVVPDPNKAIKVRGFKGVIK